MTAAQWRAMQTDFRIFIDAATLKAVEIQRNPDAQKSNFRIFIDAATLKVFVGFEKRKAAGRISASL